MSTTQVKKARKNHTPGQSATRDRERAQFRAAVLAKLPQDPYVEVDVKQIARELEVSPQKVVSALTILVDSYLADYMGEGKYARPLT